MPGTPPPADELLQGLPPVADAGARVLILGSMPGVRSLDETRYYAHPRNAFWPILAAWIGRPHDAPYVERIDALRNRGIALWDVIGRCRRAGSLDSRIDPASIQANDLAGLFTRCRRLERVLLNGARAAQDFERRVVPTLDKASLDLPRIRLPSTSPAHAAMSLAAKRAAWDCALEPVLGPDR